MPNNPVPPSAADRLIVRGIHLELTDALRAAAAEKTARLFRHEEHIIRLRIDVECDKTQDINHRFVAKGQIEIRGPDLIASVSSEDAYKCIDLLVDKLDGLLRKRHSHRKENLHHPHGVEISDSLPKTSPA
jgi:putative sigma-54 modulation protein